MKVVNYISYCCAPNVRIHQVGKNCSYLNPWFNWGWTMFSYTPFYEKQFYVATIALGSWPKQRGLQGCGPRRSLGVTQHAPGIVRKCEGMNPHTLKGIPLWEMESRWIVESSKGNCRGQNTMAWGVLYIIKNFLEHRCLKWALMTHLNI
jgi:hypothetical protein